VADRIRAVFPTLVAMEELGSVDSPRRGSRAEQEASIPQQLGDYVVLHEIARGGMGIVYEAVQQSLGRHVALKVLPSVTGHDLHRLERFQREARAAARLHHTNIVPVFGVGEQGGVHYFAMQFIHGQSLDNVLAGVRRLRDCKTPDGANTTDLTTEIAGKLWAGPPDAPPPASARAPGSTSSISTQSATAYYRNVAQVAVQVADALDYAHQQGVLHRDIKPSNLILDTKSTVWVTDFGLAKEGGTEDLTRVGDIVGTLRYLAPERFRGHTDVRSDVYSLGLTLYEMVTLRPAFSALERASLVDAILHEEPLPPRKLDAHVPRDLETIILKAIAKLPGKRYSSGAEIAEDLRRFLADRPVRARRASPVERMWRLCRRNPLVSALTALAAVLLLVAAGSIAWMVRDRSARRDKIRSDVTEVLQAARGLLTENRPDLARQKLAEVNVLVSSNRQVLGSLADSIDALTHDLDELQRFLDSTDRAFQAELVSAGWRSRKAVPFLLQAIASYEALQARPSLLEKGQHEQIRRTAYENLLWLAHDVLSWGQDHASGRPVSPQSAAQQALRYLQKAETVHAPTWAFYDLRANCRQALGEGAAAAADRELARKTPPSVAWDHYVRGLDAFYTGKKSKAIEAFQAALHLEPTAFWSLVKVGWCLCDHGQGPGDFEAAAVAFTGCIMNRPEFGYGYFCRANAYTKLGKLTEAMADYSRAIELEPKLALAWANRGYLYILLRRWTDAVADCSRSIELEAANASAWHSRGAAREKLGQYEKALADYSKALQIDPRFTPAWIDRGNLRARRGLAVEAVTDLTRAIELEPKNAVAWATRGSAYGILRRPDKALADYSTAVRLDPRYAPAWTSRGNAHVRLGQLNAALADYARAIEVNPADFQTWYNRGVVHLRLQQWQEAVRANDRAIALNPRSAAAWGDRGIAHAAVGHCDEAFADFSKALQLDPKNAGANNAFAWLLANHPDPEKRDSQRAVRLARQAVELAAENGYYWSTLGAAYYRAGAWKEALTAMEKSTRLRKSASGFQWFFLAMAHHQLGHSEEARKYHDRAVQWMQKHLPDNGDLRRLRAEAAALLNPGKQ
jgi:tetratricopeptide (TPR) repeat protein